MNKLAGRYYWFQGVLSAGFDKFVESGKELGGKLVELAKVTTENINTKESFATFTDSKRSSLRGFGRSFKRNDYRRTILLTNSSSYNDSAVFVELIATGGNALKVL